MNRYLNIPWGHRTFIPPPTALYGGMHKGFEMHIVRLAVSDGGMELEWLPCPEAACYRITVARRGESVGFANNVPAGLPPPQQLPQGNTTSSFAGLVNGIDYEVTVLALDADNKLLARSFNRLFRTGVFPGRVVNYIHPDDYTYAFSGRSPASPFILRLPSGVLLVSHDVYWQEGGQNLTIIFRSADGGKSWHYLTELCPCYWGKMFWHNGAVYMMGLDSEYGNYLIGRSEDEGRTWSKPVTLLGGGNSYTGGPHQAPTPVVFHAGRVWTAVEKGAWRLGYHHSGVLSAPVNSNLLRAESWVLSPYVAHNPAWPGAVAGGSPALLEGNVLVLPDGKIGNLLRYHTKGAVPEYGVAVLLSLDPAHPKQPQEFVATVALDGNYTKFYTLYDEQSQQYYMLCNMPDASCTWRRDVLSLAASPDAVHWQVVSDLINLRDSGWCENAGKAGVQYPSWTQEGDDMLAVVRTALNGAWNYHNANAITFHRFADFRKRGRPPVYKTDGGNG